MASRRARPQRVSPKSVLESFEALVESIRRGGAVLDTSFEARVALGRTLATRLMDVDEKSLAGVSKEYRAVVAEIMAEVQRDDDDDTFGSDLPAAVRNPPRS